MAAAGIKYTFEFTDEKGRTSHFSELHSLESNESIKEIIHNMNEMVKSDNCLFTSVAIKSVELVDQEYMDMITATLKPLTEYK